MSPAAVLRARFRQILSRAAFLVALSLFFFAALHTSAGAGARGNIRLEPIAGIPIGSRGYMVALSRNGDILYAAQNGNHSIAMVDLRTEKLIRTIPMPCRCQPQRIAISKDGQRIYAGSWSDNSNGELTIIDGSSGAAKMLHVGGSVPDLALSADGSTLYMAMCRSGIRKLDTRTGRIQTIYKQFCPWGIALSPDEKSIWVNFQGGGPNGSWGHDSIGKLDAASSKLLGVVSGIANVGGAILISRDGKTVWADGVDACSAQPYDHVGCPAVPAGIVHILDAPNVKLLRTVPKPREGTIAFSADQSFVAFVGDQLLLIDSRDFHPVGELARRFMDVAFSPDGRYAYASSLEAPEIVVLRILRQR